MEYLLYLGALALIAVGLAGTVIPAIPGLPIIFAGSWLIGWASGYELIAARPADQPAAGKNDRQSRNRGDHGSGETHSDKGESPEIQ